MKSGLGFFGAALLAAGFFACSSSTNDTAPVTPAEDAAVPVVEDAAVADTFVPEDAADAADTSTVDAAGTCASTFGHALTVGFGRIDGTVWAVQKPSDTQCTLPNKTHVVVQVLAGGAIYRMVANVKSDQGPPNIFSMTFPHALPAPAFADGWHLGASLDYVTSLGVHSTDAFTSMDLDQATAEITGALTVGAPVSVYATVGTGVTDSAHLIHRNDPDEDGAIVANPTSASPTFLLFHFDEQVF